MKVVIQRSKKSSVKVEGKTVGAINHGLVLLVGIAHEDTIEDINWCAKKISAMRIFEDEGGKMNLSIKDIGGQILSISQFTLYGNAKKGNRPSFIQAARPEQATTLYNQFNHVLKNDYGLVVETGIFGADMAVSIENDGPVTIILDSKE